MCLISISAIAQKSNFQLQSDGTFLLENGKSFFIDVVNSEPQKELYNKVLNNITKLYVSPQNVISKVDNEMISVNGIAENCVSLKGMMGIKVLFSIQYNLQFQFKDGKIRVDAPTITRLFTENAPDIKPFSGWLKAQNVFKKDKPNPKKQPTIDNFNNTLNTLINTILDFSKSDEW